MVLRRVPLLLTMLGLCGLSLQQRPAAATATAAKDATLPKPRRSVGAVDVAQRVTISNSMATVIFECGATDGWPSRVSASASPPDVGAGTARQQPPASIFLAPRSPGSWEVALHNATDTATLLKVFPANCSSFTLDTSEPAALSMVWRACETRTSGGISKKVVAVDVTTHWVLPSGSDTLHTTVEANVTNADETPYRLWLVRHPRIAIQQLGTNGSDRLARGLLGGDVRGDPIGYRDPSSGLKFPLTSDPNHDADIVSTDSLDPGSWTVPVCAYYDTLTATGLYLANDDCEGYIKGQYLEHVDNGLGFQVVQFPDGNIFEAVHYSSPYSVLLAVLPSKADWVAASVKYREQTYSKSAWYNGPAGSTRNHAVPKRMKTNPLYGDLHTGNGYTAAGMAGGSGQKSVPGFDAAAVQSRVDFLFKAFGKPFPMVLLNRFMYDPPTEVTVDLGYVPSPSMADVHALVRSMEVAGHHTVVHSLTEKTAVDVLKDTGNCREPCETAPTCDQPPWGKTYCNALDPALLELNTANEPLMAPGLAAPWWHFGAVYCTAGPPNTRASPRANWAEWFADVSAQIANTLGASGGHAWNEPTAMAGWCFDKNHSHVPGFGKWMSDGWKSIMQSVKDKMKPELTVDGLPFIIESATASFSAYVSVQNDVAFRFAGGLATPGFTPAAPQMWAQAPVWQVPMMQYAADNMRIGDVYSEATLSLPYTSAMSHPWFVNTSDTAELQRLWLFEPFPSITASLSCWSMAKRVLARQGSILLSDNMMVDINRLQQPGSNPANLAAVDMLEYYKALLRFLTTEPHMAYHAGSIERPPTVELTNATQSFTISAQNIEEYLPQLHAAMQLAPSINYSTSMDLDWQMYRPLNELLGVTGTYGAIWLPNAPDDTMLQSWLPHGMYRHHDGQSLALLLSNPWVPVHRDSAGQRIVAMNPFHFNFHSPHSSPAPTYKYRIVFDPADYTGFPHCFTVKHASYMRDGRLSLSTDAQNLQESCGRTELNGTAAASNFASFIFSYRPT